MKPFDYHRAADAADAVATVTAAPNARFLGGGTNLIDHMRLGITEPNLLVDVSHLELTEIVKTDDDGLLVGASVRNSDLAADPLVRSRYPVLSRALLAGASGQLRNMATVGGNLLQRTRCSYFQDVTTPCNKRDPGSGCSAIGGMSRNLAIIGVSDACIANHPSDMAVAMAALDAEVVVLGEDGERRIPIEQFYRLPGDEPQRDTTLEHGELITGVAIPQQPVAAHSTYRKVRERASYAFAFVSVAAALQIDDGAITDVRLAFGGIAPKPWRATRAEERLRGAAPTEDAFTEAAQAELTDATPQPDNAYKIPLARNALVATLRQLAEGAQ
ncbi:xanthine dehydrogenase family protein subunit M [Epidermidibacterium keratini]|uniref:Xanthine dehydrogenase family protein subunit M n=1 Tax=Epidermidibacterium keratini TaxID=1891644 RepID=A0A7L4YMB4_9ACTN|nr:xanthine dehydrogenase family protein subunit M [Epidermidibacterium keratini]QHC00425.1 xanthine dehydrogenase family protein subunit M [Epidermidibacterium keratini]